MFVQFGEAFRGRDGARPGLDAVHQILPVIAPIGIFRKARIADPFRMSGSSHKTLEGLFAGDGHHHISVRGLERAEHRSARRCHRKLRPLDFVRCQAEHRFQHRDVDVLTFLTELALVQGRRNRAKGIDAREDVGVINSAIVRPVSPGLVRQMGHVVTRGGMDDRRIGRQFRRRPGLAVSGNRTIDQLRIESLQGCVVELQSSHDAGAEIFNDDVRARDKPADRVDRIGRFQIEDEAFLAGVELAEEAS